ncbi:UNVERIFIED_CONTAM: type II/IV secretion system protein, partial [Salmonella enterica subsp. enterica serovar Weltevreden]
MPVNAVPSPITGDLLARARVQAGRGSVMQALIDLSGSTPDDMCARVAAQLGLRAMHSADLHALTMALGGIRFSEALARSVV